MRVALTGTPGAGKTTLAREAAAHGWTVVDVGAWARDVGVVVGRDEADDADVVDVDLLAAAFPADDGRRDALYEGHLSHGLPVDAVWVVRLDPDVLRGRLAARGYAAEKVRENLEAEALDILLQEALATGRPVVQRDGTRRTPAALWQSFAEARPERLKGPDLEPVDWSDRLPV